MHTTAVNVMTGGSYPKEKTCLTPFANYDLKGSFQDRQSSFSDFFNTYYSSLLRLGMSLSGSREISQDILQSFFLEIWEKGIWEKEIRYMKAYLFRSFYRRMTKELDKQKRMKKPCSGHQYEIESKTPETDYLRAEEQQIKQRLVQKMLAQLSTEEQRMISLRYLMGLDYEEITGLTGKSKRTVYNQIHGGVKRLKMLIK